MAGVMCKTGKVAVMDGKVAVQKSDIFIYIFIYIYTHTVLLYK